MLAQSKLKMSELIFTHETDTVAFSALGMELNTYFKDWDNTKEHYGSPFLNHTVRTLFSSVRLSCFFLLFKSISIFSLLLFKF